MADFQIAFNLSTYEVTIQTKGDALPAGSNKIGEFTHADVEISPPGLEFDVNHVIWHHVREALYKTSAKTGLAVPNTLTFPDNITDMQRVILVLDTDFIPVVSIAITPAGTSTLTVAAPTVQLGVTFTPTNASNKKGTYTSSAPAVATVSASGLVTRVSNGSAVITVTTEDGAKSATKAITCTD